MRVPLREPALHRSRYDQNFGLASIKDIRVIGVLRHHGSVEINAREEPLGSGVSQQLGIQFQISCSCCISSTCPAEAAASAPSLNFDLSKGLKALIIDCHEMVVGVELNRLKPASTSSKQQIDDH